MSTGAGSCVNLRTQLRYRASANTLGAAGNGHLVQGLAQPAQFDLGIAPTPEAPTAGRQSPHSASSMHPLGICCTNLNREADAQRSPDAQSVAASLAPQPRRLVIHLGRQSPDESETRRFVGWLDHGILARSAARTVGHDFSNSPHADQLRLQPLGRAPALILRGLLVEASQLQIGKPCR